MKTHMQKNPSELHMRPALLIAVLVLTVAPMCEGQNQSASGSHKTSVEEVIRKLDNDAFKHRFMLMRQPLIASTLLIS